MSSQQINLLNPQLLTPRVSFSTRTITLTLLAIVALGLALYALVESSARGIEQQLSQAQSKRDELQAKLAATAHPSDQEQGTEDKLAQAVAQEKKHIIQLETLRTALGAARGKVTFSQRLDAFAHEGVPGVWLTGFEVGDQSFHLEGRALQVNLIPDYLALLARQAALKDLPLTGFSITKPESEGVTPAMGVAFSVNPDTSSSAAGTN